MSVVIGASSEVMPRHRWPDKGFEAGLSLSDAFRAAEEALSGQPDASQALLHTFHPSAHSAALARAGRWCAPDLNFISDDIQYVPG